MYQQKVRRLTFAESVNERHKSFEEVPPLARIVWVCEYLGKSDRRVAYYRKLLFEKCLEYQTITCVHGIDKTPLLKRQVELLKEFSDLIGRTNNEAIALSCYHLTHPSPLDVQGTTECG